MRMSRDPLDRVSYHSSRVSIVNLNLRDQSRFRHALIFESVNAGTYWSMIGDSGILRSRTSASSMCMEIGQLPGVAMACQTLSSERRVTWLLL